LIASELRRHAPFTALGTLTGIVILLTLLGAHVPAAASARLFWFTHPAHVLLSALVTAAMFRLHGGRGVWRTLWIGYVGSVGIATLSDCIIPFLGEWLLGIPHRGLHLGFVERWWLVNPLALAGIGIGVWRPHTKVSHALHVLLSTWASLFHMTMALDSTPSVCTILIIAVFLFLAVWVPCCTSDIVFPLLFASAPRRGRTRIRPEVRPFLVAAGLLGLVVAGSFGMAGRPAGSVAAVALALAASGYLLYFFRDPERTPPADADVVVAAADGVVAAVVELDETRYLQTRCVRLSIFLSLFDVHVNRAPMAGEATFLGYFPGRRLFTFQEKSSDVNQHNKILIVGERTRCLVCQIVGPVCRRVIYWLPHDRAAPVVVGTRIGMMKFGSRLDFYLPAAEVDMLVARGTAVRAGETVVARIKAHARKGPYDRKS